MIAKALKKINGSQEEKIVSPSIFEAVKPDHKYDPS